MIKVRATRYPGLAVADMSVVTNIMLCGTIRTTSLLEIDLWMEAQHHHVPLTDISRFAGGDKSMECRVYAGAFDFFPTPKFLAFLPTVTWFDTLPLQVMVREQHDDFFKIYTLDRFENRILLVADNEQKI
jgi:hypothetical protein